jgi:predicted outer membrane protein
MENAAMNKLLPVAIAAALSLGACTKHAPDADDTPAPATMAQPAPAPAPATTDGTPVAAASHADGYALGLLATLDENEIAAARQAQGKKVGGAVLDYAKMMERDHGMNLDKTRTLGPSMDDPDMAAMKAKGERELQTLDAESGAAYEKAYITAMVNGHQEALDAIDGKMMPAATRDDVKQHLADTRKAVETHLAKAKEIAAGM